jgi:hypothetical protein
MAQLLALVQQARSGYMLGSRTKFRQPRGHVSSHDLSLVAQRPVKNASPVALSGSSPDVTIEIL